MGKLTEYAIRSLKPKATLYRVADGNGLTLEVRPAPGGRYWRYRYRLAGKASMATLGEYPAIGLAEARDRLRAARELVQAGSNPTHVGRMEREQRIVEEQEQALALLEQQQQDSDTFLILVADWQASHAGEWSPRTAQQVKGYFSRDVLPLLGSLPVRDVSRENVRDVVDGVASGRRPKSGGDRVAGKGSPAAARQVRQWIAAAFAYAIKRGRADVNPTPAAEKRKGYIPTQSAALRLPDLGKLLRLGDVSGAQRHIVIALRLLSETMVRTQELRLAKWREFQLDGEAPMWTIPAARMKMRRSAPDEHLVPLSAQCVVLLRELRELTGMNAAGWLFPNTRNPSEPMSATTLNRVIERLGFTADKGQRFHAHGFRSTASTALHEAGFMPDWIEKQLAHATPGVRGIYSRAAYLPERRKMLQAWSDMIGASVAGAAVIPIRRSA